MYSGILLSIQKYSSVNILSQKLVLGVTQLTRSIEVESNMLCIQRNDQSDPLL